MSSEKPPILVEGFPRCGSSLTMQMLHATGIPTIGAAPAFEDDRFGLNPRRNDYLSGCSNVAVKVLEPSANPVFVKKALIIWLDRDHDEQAKSFSKFASATLGLPPLSRDQRRIVAASYRNDRSRALRDGGADKHPTLYMRFELLISQPRIQASRMVDFLCAYYPQADADKMAAQVAFRGEHGANCLPYLLEAELIDAIHGPTP